MAKIGLVTVLYKSEEVLQGFFKSVSLQDHKDYILYLVDNSAGERSDSVISKCLMHYPVTECRHIRNTDNIGVAAGNNLGINLSIKDGCSYIVLMNNDIEIEQADCLSRLVSVCEEGKADMAVPKIYYFGTTKLWMAGGHMDRWRALGVHDGYRKEDDRKYNTPRYITYAPTCFIIIDKRVFEKTGLMDEKYFAYYDDVDFVLRATRTGFRLYYEPAVSILHKVSFITGGNSPFYAYYSNRNKIYFIRKNFKGLRKYFSIFYTLVSRIGFYLKYNSLMRKELLKGLRDGFYIPVYGMKRLNQ